MVSASGISLDSMMFSTPDRDNDVMVNYKCALRKKSGWWHGSCSYANINGVFSEQFSLQQSVYWKSWKLSGLKKTIMMIKPNNNDD